MTFCQLIYYDDNSNLIYRDDAKINQNKCCYEDRWALNELTLITDAGAQLGFEGNRKDEKWP